MRHEVKKVTMVVNEILTHLLLNGAENVNVEVMHNEKGSRICFTQKSCHFSQTFINELDHNLNTQRQNEVEGYYWNLVGSDDVGDELHLVGAMIDSANVTFEEGTLNIEIIRNGGQIN